MSIPNPELLEYVCGQHTYTHKEKREWRVAGRLSFPYVHGRYVFQELNSSEEQDWFEEDGLETCPLSKDRM